MSNPVGFILTDEELHAADPCPHSMFDQQRLDYGRAVERLLLRKLREQQHAASISGQWRLSESGSLQRISNDGLTPLHIIPEVSNG